MASQGEETILSASYGEGDDGGAVETQAYWERAVGSGRALAAKIWAGADADQGRVGDWRGEVQLGVKQQLAQVGPFVVAAQASALVSAPQAADPELGAELRGGAGLSLPAGGFLNAEAAARALDERIEPRGEVTLGRAAGPWLVYAQADLQDRRAPRYELVSVWFPGPRWGLQLGLRAGADDNHLALSFGLWRRGQ